MTRRMSPTRRARIFEANGGVCHICGLTSPNAPGRSPPGNASSKRTASLVNGTSRAVPFFDMEARILADADRIEELEVAIDSAEIKHGLTSNGNLWRFWSKRACDAAKQSAELDAENARLCGALNKLDNLTARDAAIVTAALQEQEKSDG